MKSPIYEEINRRFEKKSHIASQYKVASIAYGLFFCLIGIVLNTIEPFKTCSSCQNALKIFIECFYIYMYSISIVWISLMCYFIIRSKRGLKVSIKNPTTGYNRRLSLAPSKYNKSIKPKLHSNSLIDKMKKLKFLQNSSPGETNTDPMIDEEERPQHLGHPGEITNFDFTYDYENGTGELYMRCGTAIFSICSMVETCLCLIQMLEAYVNNHQVYEDCKPTFIVTILARFLSLIFVFLQSFFIFKYANIVINYGKNSACISLMHLVVTNVCVSLRTIVYETISEIEHHNAHTKTLQESAHKPYDNHHHKRSYEIQKNFTMEQYICLNPLEVHPTGVLRGVLEAEKNLAPYLYPCMIEYSLMSMTVFFILWESIETKFHDLASRRASKLNIRDNSVQHNQALVHSESEHRYVNQFTVDCGKSTTGLFIGMVVLLLTLMSLISYFIYKNINEHVAIMISRVTEVVLLCISMIVILFTYFKLRFAKFERKYVDDMNYNEMLIIVGLGGIYLFSGYSIIAILNSGLNDTLESLSLVIQIIVVFESTLQSILIINCLKMYTKDIQNKKNKPARSSIILLILIDVSLWMLETFSIKKYDMNTVQLDYYDIVFWSIVSSISSPFAIFFRFHASVCLSDIWKTLYE